MEMGSEDVRTNVAEGERSRPEFRRHFLECSGLGCRSRGPKKATPAEARAAFRRTHSPIGFSPE